MAARAPLIACLALVVAFAAGVARAENIGIDVSVDTADLDPQVTAIGITCMVCTVDCEAAAGAQVIGTGTASAGVPAPHAYKGVVSVSVPTSSSKGTDYLCRMAVSNGAASFVAGTGPDWTLPDENQPFTSMLKGKLPAAKAPVATKCKNGMQLVNGKCTSGNVASAPAKTCPDGQPMPANGNCGVVGPTIDLPNILQIFTPCPNNQPRKPDGTCPATGAANNANNAGNSNSQVVLQPCPDGQARLKTGQCPGPKSISRSNIFGIFKLPAPEAPR
jgi:hypothetical protein